jgi:hypothetical protein
MREHGPGDRVADGVDTLDAGLVVRVGLDAPTLVQRYADLLLAKPLS